jgi:myo-inositol-1(or 4)-monophosphatase
MAYTMSKEELGEIYTFALDLGRRAGKILLDGVNKRTGDVSERSSEGEVQVEKMNAVDIVT